ncbi:MAG: hypothetical protein ACOZFS_05505 [Thermodesulfobacteriota bacterium]
MIFFMINRGFALLCFLFSVFWKSNSGWKKLAPIADFFKSALIPLFQRGILKAIQYGSPFDKEGRGDFGFCPISKKRERLLPFALFLPAPGSR